MLMSGLTYFVGPAPVEWLSYSSLSYGIKMGYLGLLIWIWCMGFIKISITLTLLRFLQTRTWRIFMYFMIGLQIAMMFGSLLFLTLQCRPLHNAWDPLLSSSETCWKPNIIRTFTYVASGLNITTDVVLSLTPLAFLLRLNRPVRERILLIVLMATGLTAAAAATRRVVLTTTYAMPGVDPMDLNVQFPTWTCVEEFLSLMAACMPSLKVPIQKLFKRSGIKIGTHVTPDINTFQSTQSGGSSGENSLGKNSLGKLGGRIFAGTKGEQDPEKAPTGQEQV